jgi:hypothetical protein
MNADPIQGQGIWKIEEKGNYGLSAFEIRKAIKWTVVAVGCFGIQMRTSQTFDQPYMLAVYGTIHLHNLNFCVHYSLNIKPKRCSFVIKSWKIPKICFGF